MFAQQQLVLDEFCKNIKSSLSTNVITGHYTGSSLNMDIVKGCTIDLFNIDVSKIETMLKSQLDASFDLTQLGQHIVNKSGLKDIIARPWKVIVCEDTYCYNDNTIEPNVVKLLVLNLPTKCSGRLMFNNEYVNNALNYSIFDIDGPQTAKHEDVCVQILFKCYNISKLPGLGEFKIITSNDVLQSFDFSILKQTFYTNVLIYYPNVETLIDICKKHGISYVQVYFSHKRNTINPSNVEFVYDNLDQSKENQATVDLEDFLIFSDLVKNANKYRVNFRFDLGIDGCYEKFFTQFFIYFDGWKREYPRRYRFSYLQGLLINPIKEDVCNDTESEDSDWDHESEPEQNL